jgi:hypothetical protein
MLAGAQCATPAYTPLSPPMMFDSASKPLGSRFSLAMQSQLATRNEMALRGREARARRPHSPPAEARSQLSASRGPPARAGACSSPRRREAGPGSIPLAAAPAQPGSRAAHRAAPAQHTRGACPPACPPACLPACLPARLTRLARLTWRAQRRTCSSRPPPRRCSAPPAPPAPAPPPCAPARWPPTWAGPAQAPARACWQRG